MKNPPKMSSNDSRTSNHENKGYKTKDEKIHENQHWNHSIYSIYQPSLAYPIRQEQCILFSW